MSHLSKLLAGGVALIVLSIVAAYMLRAKQSQPEADKTEVVLVHSGEGVYRGNSARRTGASIRNTRGRISKSSPDVTSGVRTVSLFPADPLPPISGYVLDHFTQWTSIPSNYQAEGITILEGAVTLSADADSSGSRTGTLESPPLQLKAPAMAAPVQSPSPMPEGAEVLLEISISDDGIAWSPWAVADRHHPPDGRRVAPPVQASLSTEDIAEQNDTSSTIVSSSTGPYLRYRLTLSANGEDAPSVADVRIWKREY